MYQRLVGEYDVGRDFSSLCDLPAKFLFKRSKSVVSSLREGSRFRPSLSSSHRKSFQSSLSPAPSGSFIVTFSSSLFKRAAAFFPRFYDGVLVGGHHKIFFHLEEI